MVESAALEAAGSSSRGSGWDFQCAVGLRLPGSAGLPRAARRALRRRRGRAGALPRGRSDHAAPPGSLRLRAHVGRQQRGAEEQLFVGERGPAVPLERRIQPVASERSGHAQLLERVTPEVRRLHERLATPLALGRSLASLPQDLNPGRLTARGGRCSGAAARSRRCGRSVLWGGRAAGCGCRGRRLRRASTCGPRRWVARICRRHAARRERHL